MGGGTSRSWSCECDWDDFCSWYLEIIKPSFGEDLDKETYEKTKYFLKKLLKISEIPLGILENKYVQKY